MSKAMPVTFHSAFNEALPDDVLKHIADHCIVTEDEMNNINYAFGHFSSNRDGQDFMFEICLDLSPDGKLEIYDLTDDHAVVISVDVFLERLSLAKPLKIESINVI